MVYVEPAPARIDELTYNERRSFSVSLASIIVSSASVLTSLVIALTNNSTIVKQDNVKRDNEQAVIENKTAEKEKRV